MFTSGAELDEQSRQKVYLLLGQIWMARTDKEFVYFWGRARCVEQTKSLFTSWADLDGQNRQRTLLISGAELDEHNCQQTPIICQHTPYLSGEVVNRTVDREKNILVM